MPVLTQLPPETRDKGVATAATPRRPLPAPARVPTRRAPDFGFNPLLREAAPGIRRKKTILVSASVAFHVLLLVVLAVLPKPSAPLEEPVRPITFVLTAPPPPLESPVARPPRPTPEPPRPEPKPEPKLEPKPVTPPPPTATVEPAPVVANAEPPKPPPVEPARPRPAVRTDVFGEGAKAPETLASKTGRLTVPSAGFDDAATGAPAQRTSARGEAVAAAFDVQESRQVARRPAEAVVRAGGFETTAAPAEAPRRRERPVERFDAEVEILSKPKPVYTDEARRLRIEGDVVLQVTFGAAGALIVHGVAEGLGHGLDEAAIAAAKKILFTPARRDGKPVDYTATLRVVFRLA